MFSEILEKFIEKCPTTVMVRLLLERLLDAERLDRWFEANRQRQYTREILFSSLVGLMLQVVCRTRANVNEAHRHTDMGTSVVAVYDKLKGVEPGVSQGLLREIAADAQGLIAGVGGARPALVPGYRVKYLDGNCLAGSEHRLKALRATTAGALPGKSLVVFDPALGLAIDVFPCPDGHAQERALLGEVVPTIAAKDLWIADRNFCVRAFLSAIRERQGSFIIRQHGSFSTKPLAPMRLVGRAPSGAVYEQDVEIADAAGRRWRLRRVSVKLTTPTRNGDTTLVVLTDLPREVADAVAVVELYRTRWRIETAFQKLERHINAEICTLGYPQAALFGFCLGLVAFNLYAVVMAALRAAHPSTDIDAEVSEYYMAAEIATTFNGLDIAVPQVEWAQLVRTDPDYLCTLLREIAAQVDLKKLRKTPRGPKKPRTPRTKFKGKSHVSTAKLLNIR
jgi:hypothetical protein